jgi:hypothetical protein
MLKASLSKNILEYVIKISITNLSKKCNNKVSPKAHWLKLPLSMPNIPEDKVEIK